MLRETLEKLAFTEEHMNRGPSLDGPADPKNMSPMAKWILGLSELPSQEKEKKAAKKEKETSTYPVSRFLTSPEGRGTASAIKGGVIGYGGVKLLENLTKKNIATQLARGDAAKAEIAKGALQKMKSSRLGLKAGLGLGALAGLSAAANAAVKRRIAARARKGRENLGTLEDYEK